ncbi:MAG: hypothetical protein EOP49_45760, partial [Sphingobacteriales bacterium]
MLRRALLFMLMALASTKTIAQTEYADATATIKSPEEVTVTALIDGYGSISLHTIYNADNLWYVNVEELFRQLKIHSVVSESGDSLAGFTANETHPYLLDAITKQVSSNGRSLNAKNGLIKEMGSLYLESSLFKEVFGMSIVFNFRSLSCSVKADFEFPVVKELRLQKMHQGLGRTAARLQADTTVGRSYHLFKAGTADWSIATTQAWKQNTLSRVSLALGAELLFGEATVAYNYNGVKKFDGKQLNYLWRWIDNDKKIIRQAEVGRIANRMISLIAAPVAGAVVRNTPTTVRKASGYYTINEQTEANWTVELYINNQLT